MTGPFRVQPMSFVRRGGRMSDGQQRAWDELAPRYRFDVQRAIGSTSVHPDARLIPKQEYGREAPLVVEIGSGQGHAIVAAATANPHRDYLAVEVYQAGLARTMLDAHRGGAENLRVVEANAPEVLQTLLPEESVDELWVFFPDPWHKTKHNKRRLIAENFTDAILRVLQPGGIIRLATDWQEYADQMTAVLDAVPELARDFAGDWAPRFEGRAMTAFERKGIARGRNIRDLSYRKQR